MSHFTTLKGKFASVRQMIDALQFMGVPLNEILIDKALGVFEGTQQMDAPRKTVSSRFRNTRSEQPCQIIVTEKGMKAMAEAAEAKQNCGYSMRKSEGNIGIFKDQDAEFGFYDCGCEENPGFVPATDPYVSGEEMVGYFTACYEIMGLRGNKDLEVSQIARDEDGNFILQVRKPQKQGKFAALGSAFGGLGGGSGLGSGKRRRGVLGLGSR